MQQVHGEIRGLGAEAFFIGPETRDNALKLMEKQNASIPLLYDHDGAVIRSYGLAFELPDYLQPAYRALGFPDVNPETGWLLPIPATYIVGTDGTIAERYLNADYTRRMEPSEILATLERLRR